MAAPFFVALKKISKPPVAVCFYRIRAQVDNFIEVLDGQLKLAELTISITPVIVCLDITRVQADGLIIISKAAPQSARLQVDLKKDRKKSDHEARIFSR